VVGVHVQVDIDQRPVGDVSGRRDVAWAAIVAAGDELFVDPLEVVGDTRERELRPQRLRRLTQRREQRTIVEQSTEAGGQRLCVSGRWPMPMCWCSAPTV
jgi:hypothetical protein